MQRPVTTFICCAIVLLVCLPSLAQRPAASLEIQMPKSEFKTGVAIRLDAIISNLSTDDLRIWKAEPKVDGMAEAYLSVRVRNVEGKSLPRIDGSAVVKNGKKYVIGKRWLTRKGVIVRPNEELHDFLVLSKLFDLREPGTYIVSSEADTPRADSGPEIKWIVARSNELTFVVK